MKTRQNTTRRLGLVLACGIIALAASAEAKKPPKPPPDPDPTGLTFTMVDVGDLGFGGFAMAINDLGTIAGQMFIDEHLHGRACIVEPVGDTYFLDGDGNGINDLIQLLPAIGEIYRSNAWDINNSGQAVGYQYVGYVSTAMVWDNGVPTAVMPGAVAYAINDAGFVVGEIEPATDTDPLGGRGFIIVPEDQDLDGRADTWYTDADGDGANDLLYLVADYPGPWGGYSAVGVLDDLSVVLEGGGGVSIVRPDFEDPDGDGNPWYADENNDVLNDLQVFLPDGFGIGGPVTPGGFVPGRADRDAALLDLTTSTYLDLGAAPKGGSAEAVAVNDAGWVVGWRYNRKGRVEGNFFWKDGVMTPFAEIASGPVSSPFLLNAINQAGVIAGYSSNGLFVAFPSESP